MTSIGIVISIISVGVTIIGLIGTAWVKLNVEIAKVNTKIIYLEKQINEEHSQNSDEFKKVDKNFDKLFAVATRIEIAMVNKEDRK